MKVQAPKYYCEREIKLKICDYCGPCSEKDQCHCDSAGGKVFVVRSDVDAEDNLLTAEDTFNALHYGNGILNANISQVAIYGKNPVICNKTSILKDQSIPY